MLHVAGAKDGSRTPNAQDALRTDPAVLPKAGLAEPLVVELRRWSRLTNRTADERTRLTNRMRTALAYYPQACSSR